MTPWHQHTLWACAWLASGYITYTLTKGSHSQTLAAHSPLTIATDHTSQHPTQPSQDPHSPPERTAADLYSAGEKILANRDPFSQREQHLAFVETMTTGELRTAFDRFSGDKVMRNLVAQRLAETDPESLLSMILAKPRAESETLDRYNEASSILFRTWALADPQKAFAKAKELQRHPEFSNAMWSVFSTTLEKDPAAAVRLASGQYLFADMERAVGGEISEKNAHTFLSAWAAMPPGQRFDSRVHYIHRKAVTLLTKTDPKAALDWVKSQSDAQRVAFMPAMLDQLAKQDPTSALAIFSSLPASPERERSGNAMATLLGLDDPAAAIEWIGKNLASSKADAAASYAQRLAASDPQRASATADALPPGPMKDSFVATTAKEWAEKSLTNAATWVQAMPDGPERRAAVDAISHKWLQQDPTTFAQYLAEAPAAEATPALSSRTALALAAKSPSDAAAWLTSLPASRSTSTLSHMSASLAYHDPARLSAMITALPAGPLQSTALQQGMTALSYYKADSAPGWLSSLSPSLRKQALSHLPQLAALDPAVRKTWSQALTGK